MRKSFSTWWTPSVRGTAQLPPRAGRPSFTPTTSYGGHRLPAVDPAQDAFGGRARNLLRLAERLEPGSEAQVHHEELAFHGRQHVRPLRNLDVVQHQVVHVFQEQVLEVEVARPQIGQAQLQRVTIQDDADQDLLSGARGQDEGCLLYTSPS